MGRPKNSKNGILTLIKFNCKECNKEFYRNPAQKETAIFCSKNCCGKYYGKLKDKAFFKRISSEYNGMNKGKTLEDIFGQEKGKAMRNQMSENRLIKLDLDKIKRMYLNGAYVKDIANVMNIGELAIYKRLHKLGIFKPKKITRGTFKKGHNFHNKKDIVKIKIGNSNRGKIKSEEFRKFRSVYMKNSWIKDREKRLSSAKVRGLMMRGFKQKASSIEKIKIARAIQKMKPCSEETKRKIGLSNKGKKRPDLRIRCMLRKGKTFEELYGYEKANRIKQKQSKYLKKKYEDKEYKETVMRKTFEALKIKPNKPEQALIKLIKYNNLPFNYVGDGKIWFTGQNYSFNPDFLSKNPKHIIEVYGDYWHNLSKSIEKDKERLETYSKYGYKTLIIWEHEIKEDINKVISKVLEFTKNSL